MTGFGILIIVYEDPVDFTTLFHFSDFSCNRRDQIKVFFVEEMKNRKLYYRPNAHHKAPVGKVFQFWLSGQLGFERNVDSTVRQELEQLMDIPGDFWRVALGYFRRPLNTLHDADTPAPQVLCAPESHSVVP